jgi:chromosome segregation ATPase
MIYISTFSLILLFLLATLIGLVIGWYWKQSKDSHLQTDIAALKEENKKLEKTAKTSDKEVNSYKRKLGVAEEKAEKEAQLSESQIASLTSQISTRETQLAEALSLNTELERNNIQLITQNDKFLKQNIALDKKYNEDLVGLKEWKSNKDVFANEAKDLRTKLNYAEEKITRLSNTNAEITKELSENKAYLTNLRVLKAQNNKLAQDVEYWEKKHYDAHHELSAIKAKDEDFHGRIAALQDKINNHDSIMQEMELKVQGFKDKFVFINNKYHKLNLPN